MSARRISQREARALRKRVRELEKMEDSRRAFWVTDYPGIHIGGVVVQADTFACVKTANRLKHAVVVIPRTGAELQFYALPVSRSNQ